MKKLSNLKGAKLLSKKEQLNVQGQGIPLACEGPGTDGVYCAGGHWCCDGVCTPYSSYSQFVKECLLDGNNPGGFE